MAIVPTSLKRMKEDMIIIPMITMKADINVSLLKKKLAEIMYIIPEYMIISRGEPPEYMYICILLSWL